MALADEDKTWILAQLPITTAEVPKHMTESIEASETRLLTAFHVRPSPADARIRSHSATIRALDLEREALKDRVEKLDPPHR